MRQVVHGRLVRDQAIWDGRFPNPGHTPSLTIRQYLLITLGALTLAFAFIRVVIFKMPEIPRYLLSKGRDAEAVDAVNFVARRNGKPEPLTLDMLQDIDAQLGLTVNCEEVGRALSRVEVMKDNFKDFKGVEYSKLFANKRLGLHTGLIWLIWLIIGMHPLPPCMDFSKLSRYCISIVLQLPTLVPGTKVHFSIIALSHIQKLLYRVVGGCCRSDSCSLYGQYTIRSTMDDGRFSNCDWHLSICICRSRHPDSRPCLFVCYWLAWQLW